MLDKVELKLKAGDGGRGAVTFRHEKYVAFGGPFGGDGGKGGSVVIKADDSVNTLRAFKQHRSFKAENGQPGMNKNKHGADAANLILPVPPGTLIFRKMDSGPAELIADLEENGQQAVVARGGNGGFGNLHYATSTNQTPHIAQPGIPGQEVIVILELRLIADVGIIGYPNVGKSSLLAALSAAKPKIADYPFTTLEPELGVVTEDNKSFVLAEIPGLIEGAHAGKGLGHEFLQHAMRTKVIIHLLDGCAASPLDDMIRVNNELALFDTALAKRPQVVVINKVDLPQVKARVAELKSAFKDAEISPIFVSACERSGLAELVKETWKLLQAANVREKVMVPAIATKVFRPKPVDRGAKVRRKGHSFILTDPAVERFLDKLDLENPEELAQFNRNLDKLGVNQLLKSSGVKNGDTLITGKFEWEWYDDEHRPDRRNV
jgi:GTP-binding protein